MKILLIEDERSLALGMIRILASDGYHVDWRSNGSEALSASTATEYDLIILDILLPGKNGWDICEELRSMGVATPIMMLSALDDPTCKARGLNLGADDFLSKPFEVVELLARVRARVRKHNVAVGQTVHVENLEIDRRNHHVRREGAMIPLSEVEFRVLEALAVAEGKPVSPAALVGKAGYSRDPILDPVETCIASLKRKVDGHAKNPLIHSTPDGHFLAAHA